MKNVTNIFRNLFITMNNLNGYSVERIATEEEVSQAEAIFKD